MKIHELEILEDDFDLFVALDDQEKIEFLFDAIDEGTDIAVARQIERLNELIKDRTPIVSSEDFQVGHTRLCVTTFTDKIYLNSDSIKAIRKFIDKLFNDGLILMRLPNEQKTHFDIYKFFRAYRIVGRSTPFSTN